MAELSELLKSVGAGKRRILQVSPEIFVDWLKKPTPDAGVLIRSEGVPDDLRIVDARMCDNRLEFIVESETFEPGDILAPLEYLTPVFHRTDTRFPQ